MDVRKILLAIARRKGLFAIAFFASFCLVVLLPQAGMAPMYESFAKILIAPSTTPVAMDGRSGVADTGTWLTDEAVLRELVTSERVLSRVIKTLNIQMNWLDLRERIGLDPLTGGLTRKVTLFALGCQDEDPKRAQQISEALVQEFSKNVEELSAREFASTRRFLEELVAEAKEKEDAAVDKLLAITSSHVDKSQTKEALDSETELENDRRKMRDEVALLESETQAMQGFLAGQSDTPPWSVLGQDSGLRTLETAVGDARLKLVEMEERYTQDNVLVVEQKAKLSKIQEVYHSRLNAYVQSLFGDKSRSLSEKRSRLNSIQTHLTELRNRQLSPEQKREVSKLEREVQVWEENHLTLVKQLYQARILEQSSRRQGAITVLENPFPGRLAKGKKQRSSVVMIIFGVPISLLFATIIILGVDYLLANMRLVPRIESTLGLPMLAVIPPVQDELKARWEAYKEQATGVKYGGPGTSEPKP